MRIAIIGFGFSGAMVATNLVRAATKPLTIYVVAEEMNARGVAYSTTNTDHLLNVHAANMGAFASDISGFATWLAGDAGKYARAKLGLTKDYTPSDYAPRALYGAYLDAIWQETQELTTDKEVEIKIVPSDAVAIHPGAELAVLTERGDAIAVDKVVLATGHEIKPILTHRNDKHIIQNPWVPNALIDAANWHAPVLLVGAGLTAIDMVLSLRRAGYNGEIIMSSRHGLLPQAHAVVKPFTFSAEEIAEVKTLRQLVRLIGMHAHAVGGWRAVVDALRPHTITLWQRLTTREQQRALKYLLPIWNVHRHRMAPEIAAAVEAERARGSVRLITSKTLTVDEALVVTFDKGDTLSPSRIINCTGPELNLARSSNALLRQLLADGLVEPHATGLGIAADMHERAWGRAHPNLYAIGAVLTGQRLESTAVPELRAQAAAIASDILAHYN